MSSPNSTDNTPLAISIHSPEISRRNLTAPMIWKIPLVMAHAAMRSSSTSPVIPGQASVTTPARMPRIPTTTSHQRGIGVSPVIAAARANPPSRKANAP